MNFNTILIENFKYLAGLISKLEMSKLDLKEASIVSPSKQIF
jgi:hypothetical protein